MWEKDPKAENLMLIIWNGREATRCDGNIYGYSNLAHILMTKAKKIQGKSVQLCQMITNYFEPNFKVDYNFQYRYRSKAINFYFMKEFACAFCMLVIFQYINYKYIILFANSVLKNATSDSNLTNATNSTFNYSYNSTRNFTSSYRYRYLFTYSQHYIVTKVLQIYRISVTFQTLL